jgi:hypothetical protein
MDCGLLLTFYYMLLERFDPLPQHEHCDSGTCVLDLEKGRGLQPLLPYMPLISFAPFYAPSHLSIHPSIYYMCNYYLSIRKEIACCTTTVILFYKGLLLITEFHTSFVNHWTIKIKVDSSDSTGTCRDDNSTIEVRNH